MPDEPVVIGEKRMDADAVVLLTQAADIVRRCLTSLERSSPAEPGFGEIEYRLRTRQQGNEFLYAYNEWLLSSASATTPASGSYRSQHEKDEST